MATSLTTLVVQRGKEALYNIGIQVATALSLPVTSWSPGDPTRSLYWYLAEVLDVLEQIVVEFVRSGFLDYAEGDDNEWLILLAEQVFGVTAVAATFATSTVTLTNNGGGLYVIEEAGQLTFRNSSTGKTYKNTSTGTLNPGPGTTLTLDVTADEAGSDSSASANEIDELVTTLLEIEVTASTAATGFDAETAASIRDRCRDKLGSLSPNGPPDAYSYVVRTPELVGTSGITRVRTDADGFGNVDVTVAGPSGAVSAADLALAQAAIVRYAAPLGVNANARNSTNVPIAITYQLWLYEDVSADEDTVEDTVEAALAAMFAVRPIGGDVISPATGRLYHSMIESTIRSVYPAHAFRVDVSTPAGNTDLTLTQVATLGTVTPTINFVAVPT